MSFKRIVNSWFYSVIMATCLLLAGCMEEPMGKREDSRFFDLAVFIEKQITLLDSLNPAVTKKVLVGDETQTQRIVDVNWARELDLFIQADISKPAVQISYEVENTSSRIRIFRARNDENPAVKYLKVEFDEQTAQIMALEAVLSQRNYLYHSEKKISLQCRKLSDSQVLIQSYRIIGFQKLIFNDKVPYQVEAQIL